MVCNVMVCAQQNLFTESGVPLTRAATLMLTDAAAAALAGARSIEDEPGGVSPASSAKPAIFESCVGYTSQRYRSCPTGQQVRTG
jgi:hypothetical protein